MNELYMLVTIGYTTQIIFNYKVGLDFMNTLTNADKINFSTIEFKILTEEERKCYLDQNISL